METIIRSPAMSPQKRKLGGKMKIEPAAASPAARREPMEQALRETPSTDLRPAEPPLTEAVRTQALLEAMRPDLEALRATAEHEGFAKGLEDGMQAARTATSEQLQRFATIVSTLTDARSGVLYDAENLAVEIVYAAACRIIGESALTREGVSGAVTEALKGLQQENELIVYLHPQDLKMIRDSAKVSDLSSVLDHYQLRQDATIKLGGCLVESANGTLDARLETQLIRLEETLLAVRKSRDMQEGGY